MADVAPAPEDRTREQPEPFAFSDARGVADRPAEQRGTLEVRSRALAHLVEHAASQVEGTVRSSTTAQKALGRGYPRASVRLDRNRAWVELDVAVVWPSPVSAVAARVRDEVLARAGELSGLDVRRVDVAVHVVPTEERAPERRRVQ